MYVIYIGADWCRYCKEVSPIIEKISQTENVVILNVTKENRQEIKDKYKISCIPAIFLSNKDGEEIDNWNADMDQSLDDFLVKNGLK